MQLILTILFFSGFSFSNQARLLDKTLAIINDQIITLSEVKRVKKTISARRNIIPQIYRQTKPSHKDIIEIKIKRIIIREKLSEIGYVVSDEEIEKTIKNRERALGINRKALIRFLKNNRLLFDEYFEITREALEFGRFSNWIIQPLISITEQEVKNAFYKENLNNRTLNFRYNLVDFSLSKSKFKKGMLKKFKTALERLQTTGVLPANYSDVKTNDLGNITEDGLEKGLRKLLKHTEEGAFSKPYLIGNQYHIFYLKRKDLVESEMFQREKNRIRAMLFQKAAQKISSLWFESEKNKHYIKYFL